MKKQNGIVVFEKNDRMPKLPASLAGKIPVISQFGFKVVRLKAKYYWKAATEEDFRASESKRLGIAKNRVPLCGGCANTGPQACTIGGCEYPCRGFCTLKYNPRKKYYYCVCS